MNFLILCLTLVLDFIHERQKCTDTHNTWCSRWEPGFIWNSNTSVCTECESGADCGLDEVQGKIVFVRNQEVSHNRNLDVSARGSVSRRSNCTEFCNAKGTCLKPLLPDNNWQPSLKKLKIMVILYYRKIRVSFNWYLPSFIYSFTMCISCHYGYDLMVSADSPKQDTFPIDLL